MRPHRALPLGDSLLGGQARTISPAMGTQQLLRVSGLDEYATEPAGFAVSVGWVPSAAAWAGAFEVVATAVWTVGGADAAVEFDVPAGGTTITLGAADSIEVRARVDGAAAITARASAMLSLAMAAHPRPVHRSQLWTMPADSGVARAIPAWARGVRLEVSNPLLLPAYALQLFPDTVGAAPLFIAAPSAGELIPVCGGAYGYALTCAAASTARAIWELQL